MSKLIIVRHGKSEWNALGLWTGWNDISITKEGEEEARKTAFQLKNIPIHKAYASKLKRAQETLRIIQDNLQLSDIPVIFHEALNERNYGIYAGKNKWQIKEEMGEEEFQKIRRSWDYSIPEGETLEDVYKRVVPFYEEIIRSDLAKGENVIVVAHGNSLRALVKHLENLSEEEILNLEIGIAEAYIYEIKNGKVISKEIKAENPERGKV